MLLITNIIRKIILALILLLVLLVPSIVIAKGEEAEEVKIEVINISELSVQEQIDYFADLYGADKVLMSKIAKAESNYKNVPNYLYDGESGYRTAYGIFQITRTTYKGFCGDPDDRKDITKNIECAMKIATKSGVHHWDESKTSWVN